MRARIPSLFVLAAVCVGSAVAQDRTPDFTIKADRTQQTAAGVVKAAGNVVASVGKLTIRADSLEARAEGDSEMPVLVAEGNVVIERDGERLQLRRLQLDVRTGRGVFDLQP